MGNQKRNQPGALPTTESSPAETIDSLKKRISELEMSQSALRLGTERAAQELAPLRGMKAMPWAVMVLLGQSLAREARLPGFERPARTIRDDCGNIWTAVPIEHEDERLIRVVCEVSAYQVTATREELQRLEKRLSKDLGDLRYARKQVEAARAARDANLLAHSAETVKRLEPTIGPIEKRIEACRAVIERKEELSWTYPAQIKSLEFAVRTVVVAEGQEPLEMDGPDLD